MGTKIEDKLYSFDIKIENLKVVLSSNLKLDPSGYKD